MSDARSQPSSVTRVFSMTTELVIAAIIGLVALSLGANGSAWILGGIAAGAIVVRMQTFCCKWEATPNQLARRIGQLLVGLTVGFSIQQNDVLALSAHIPVFLLLTLCLVFSGIVAAFVYSRSANIDLLTALLATTPGNIGAMASIAADYGKNPALVSLVQLMRFTAVTSVIPLLTRVTQNPDVSGLLHTLAAQIVALKPSNLADLSLVLLLATLSIQIGHRLKIPIPALLCPLIVGLGFNGVFTTVPFLPTIDFNPPLLLSLLGQILLGITIGEYWGINPAFGRVAISRGAIPVGMMIASGFLTAGLAMLMTDWDWMTCLLVTAPGGSPEMIWIAIALNQDVEIVTVGHLVRLVLLNAFLPLILAWFTSSKPKVGTSTKPSIT